MIARHKYYNQIKKKISIQILFVLGILCLSFTPFENEGKRNIKGIEKEAQVLPVNTSQIEKDQRLLPMVSVDSSLFQASQAPLIHLPDPAFVLPNVADFRISTSGGLGTAGFNQAIAPALAYNTTERHYMVVWQGDDDTGSKDEIYGRLVDAFSAQIIGDSDIRLAEFTGTDDFDLKNPDIVYNSVLNEYLLIWQGVDKLSSSGLPAEEIFGRRISADGSLLNLDGTPGDATSGYIRISYMGSDDNNADYDALHPAVAYNAASNTYMIVWHGDDDAEAMRDNEFEIFGQMLRFSNNELTTTGINFQISDVAGDNGLSSNDAKNPDVVFNATNNEWMVVWEGEELNPGEPEIYGQRLNANGSEIILPSHNFQISTTPAQGNEARQASIAWNSNDNQYLVAWTGEGSGVADEFDVFGILLNADGSDVGTGDQIRISDMGPDAASEYRAFAPQIDYSSFDNEFLVIWSGDDDILPLSNGEFEIFGQRIMADGSEVGLNDFRISDMGPNGIVQYGAHSPALIYTGSELNSYLTIWSGDDNTETVDDELEIFGRLLSPVADLAVTKTDGVTSIIAGSEITYTITLTNSGPDDAVNTIVSDIFQPELKNVAWTAIGTGGASGFSTAGVDVIADSGVGLPAAATIIYTVKAIVDSSLDQGTFLSNTVQVLDVLTIDPDLSNNQAIDNDTEVIRVADLEITKTDNTTLVLAGDTLTYSITVSNLGPVSARKTTVVDSFPDEIISVDWMAVGTGGATGFDATGTGDIIDTLIFLPIGSSVTYTAYAAVDPNTANNTALTNTATIMDSVASDPNLANNSATDDNTVVITDNEPPVITLAPPTKLWPPNHKYNCFKIEDFVLSVEDNVDGIIPVTNVHIDSASSDEPENVPEAWEEWFELLLEWFRNLDWGHDDEEEAAKIADMYLKEGGSGDQLNCFWGDGYTFNDIVIGDSCNYAKLRAERLGSGNGRVYHIYISVSDSVGNVADTMYTVTVPKSKKKPAVDDGPVYMVVSECNDEEEQIALPKLAEPQIPDQYALLQNYPNPFNPETEIRFQLPQAGLVEIRIYNMLGQQIRLLTSSNYEAGYHSIRWNGRDARGSNVASGVYIYELRTGNFVAHKKLVLTR